VEEKHFDWVIIIGIVFGICVIGYFMLITHGEGDPYFVFAEVPVSATLNSSVIHLEDNDIMNIQGLDVIQQNGKITRIYVRYSGTNPKMNIKEFKEKYSSNIGDPSSRKYLEYNGTYYFATWMVP